MISCYKQLINNKFMSCMNYDVVSLMMHATYGMHERFLNLKHSLVQNIPLPEYGGAQVHVKSLLRPICRHSAF